MIMHRGVRRESRMIDQVSKPQAQSGGRPLSRHVAVASSRCITQLRALKDYRRILLFSFAEFNYPSHRGICYLFYHPVTLLVFWLSPRIFDKSKKLGPPR